MQENPPSHWHVTSVQHEEQEKQMHGGDKSGNIAKFGWSVVLSAAESETTKNRDMEGNRPCPKTRKYRVRPATTPDTASTCALWSITIFISTVLMNTGRWSRILNSNASSAVARQISLGTYAILMNCDIITSATKTLTTCVAYDKNQYTFGHERDSGARRAGIEITGGL
jgi:hypothetical protein